MTLRLVGLPGALRHASRNRMLLRNAATLFGEAEYIEGDLLLPLYDADLQDAGMPEAAQALSDLIAGADAVILSTPEYNKGVSAVLKNALEWVSRTEGRPFRDKPVAVMSAASGASGGERAQAMLRQCLVSFRPRLITGPELHVARCREQFDEAGRLTNERYAKVLAELMDGLRREVARG